MRCMHRYALPTFIATTDPLANGEVAHMAKLHGILRFRRGCRLWATHSIPAFYFHCTLLFGHI